MVPSPQRPMPHVNLPELMKDLGFVVEFHGEGYMKLDHSELIIEFLIKSLKPKEILYFDET